MVIRYCVIDVDGTVIETDKTYQHAKQTQQVNLLKVARVRSKARAIYTGREGDLPRVDTFHRELLGLCTT